MYFNPYALFYLFSGGILLVLTYWAWTFRSTRGAKYFSLLTLSSAVYSLAYAMEISSLSLETVLFWLRIEYFGIALIPAFLALFALDYTAGGKKISSALVVSLFIIPAITIALFVLNHYLGFFYLDVKMESGSLFPVISFQRGIWYWVHSFYISAAVFFSNILFVLMWVSANQVYRRQITVMLIGSLVPWAGFLIYLARPVAWSVDPNPIFLSLSALFFFWGLKRYRLFDLTPIARTRLFEELPDGVLILDSRMRIVDMNYLAGKLLKLKPDELGSPAEETLTNWPKLVKLIVKTENRYHVELPLEISGSELWFRVDFIPLQEAGAGSYGKMIILRDITDRRMAEKKLQYLATTDDLTGLWNRRYFYQSAEKELKRARRYNHIFSLLMIDIDRFKMINDAFGHSAGDKTLQHLASLIKNRLREVDLTARLGGEEFGVLLPDTDIDCAYNLAENLREAIASTPLIYEDREIFITVSIGATVYNNSITGVDDMLKSADGALYVAKDKGRNLTVRSDKR